MIMSGIGAIAAPSGPIGPVIIPGTYNISCYIANSTGFNGPVQITHDPNTGAITLSQTALSAYMTVKRNRDVENDSGYNANHDFWINVGAFKDINYWTDPQRQTDWPVAMGSGIYITSGTSLGSAEPDADRSLVYSGVGMTEVYLNWYARYLRDGGLEGVNCGSIKISA